METFLEIKKCVLCGSPTSEATAFFDLRKNQKLLQLFPISAKIFGMFKVFDSITVPFLNGGELQVILKRRA